MLPSASKFTTFTSSELVAELYNIDEIELPKEEQEYKVILKEITPPDGYNASGDIEFNINVVMKDGKYQLKDEEVFNNNNAEITINNNFINIKVTNEKNRGY
jgi:hypothetical protein